MFCFFLVFNVVVTASHASRKGEGMSAAGIASALLPLLHQHMTAGENVYRRGQQWVFTTSLALGLCSLKAGVSTLSEACRAGFAVLRCKTPASQQPGLLLWIVPS